MSMPTVTTLPNEILFCIVENVEWRDIQSMIFTCKTIEKKLLDCHIGALRLNKRFSEFLDSHSSTPQVIEKHHILSFLPLIHGAVIYYKDCNILPLFKSAIQILDSIGMKEMIIPSALFMASSKAEGQKFNEAISLLTWAKNQIQGITYQGGQINMPRRITNRISEVFAFRPTDWGAGLEHVVPVMLWYHSVYIYQAPVQTATRNTRRMELSGEGGSQTKLSPKRQCAYGLSERGK
ncbi:hypothetical protein V2G26_007024 [Clonostachys chloroleuca]